MHKKYFYNFITTALIISFILTSSFGAVSKAHAQSVAGYAKGLVPIIATLPQCKNLSPIKKLFSGLGLSSNNTMSNVGGAIDNTDLLEGSDFAEGSNLPPNTETDKNLDDTASSATQVFDSINTNITGTPEGKAILETYENSKATKAAVESLNENSTCIQSIGRLIIKMLLQKLTVSTVNWINSGFDGSPAFIQDPGKFFNDIAKNEILQFGLEINNPELFPFGKAWLRGTATAFNNKFQDNAKYSLDKLVQQTNPEYSGIKFQQDFSLGGWNAWTAMTAPQNNPLGFKLLADNEIQRRLAGTTQSAAQNIRDALQQADGFLGDQRCADPKGLTREKHDEALRAGIKVTENGKTTTVGTCQRWEYVTPGKLISEATTTAINYQNNSYLNVEDLNDAVAAILDALLGQFSTNLMEKGFSNLEYEGVDGTLIYDENRTFEIQKTQTEEDFAPIHLSSSWLSSNPNFNIRTDLTQALIDEQRTYSEKLILQNKELMSTTDGDVYKLDEKTGLSNAYGLIPAIHQLDYCIPGPHPGWENDSRQILAAATGAVLPETQQSLDDLDISQVGAMAKSVLPMAGAAAGAMILTTGFGTAIAGAAIGSVFPIVGTIVGAIVGTLIASFFGDGDPGSKVRTYYSVIIQGLTGYLPDYENGNDDRILNISSKQGAVGVLNLMLDRYIQIMSKTYFSTPDNLPAIAKEAGKNFGQLRGYSQMISNNEEKIALMENIVKTLGEIKSKVDDLNEDLKSENISEEEYKNKLKDQINAFGRLSENMVNGNDIASSDNLLKQIVDKKEYIYTNLLKGPYGCEAELEKKSPPKFPAPWEKYDINTVKRMPYPLPILYDYNVLVKGDPIPDPLNNPKIYDNKMPAENKYDSFGPGFLSFVLFSDEGDDRRGPERLFIADLLPSKHNPRNTVQVSVGQMKEIQTHDDKDPLYGSLLDEYIRGGPFEATIGVY